MITAPSATKISDHSFEADPKAAPLADEGLTEPPAEIAPPDVKVPPVVILLEPSNVIAAEPPLSFMSLPLTVRSPVVTTLPLDVTVPSAATVNAKVPSV